MLKIIFLAFTALLRSRRQLALESAALRHQLEVLPRNAKRPRLRPTDRAFWVVLTRIFPDWQRHLTIVKPDTVIRWHRAGWRLYWRWRSKPGPGRPKVSAEVRALIRRMSLENRLWGAVLTSSVSLHRISEFENPNHQAWVLNGKNQIKRKDQPVCLELPSIAVNQKGGKA